MPRVMGPLTYGPPELTTPRVMGPRSDGNPELNTSRVMGPSVNHFKGWLSPGMLVQGVNHPEGDGPKG